MNWLGRALVVSPCYLTLCRTEREFEGVQKHLKVPKRDRVPFLLNKHADATTHFFESRGKLCAVVCLPENTERERVEILGLLVHEAVHVWQQVRRALGETNPSDEFEAYSVQAIAQQLMQAYETP